MMKMKKKGSYCFIICVMSGADSCCSKAKNEKVKLNLTKVSFCRGQLYNLNC